MSEFFHDDFLMKTAAARRLYHEFAAGLPIIDFHDHLNVRELADDRRFDNLAQLWIANDPYKHRAMRIAGVPERFITGDTSDREKFDVRPFAGRRAAGLLSTDGLVRAVCYENVRQWM
jgi:glucuronate isomerase